MNLKIASWLGAGVYTGSALGVGKSAQTGQEMDATELEAFKEMFRTLTQKVDESEHKMATLEAKVQDQQGVIMENERKMATLEATVKYQKFEIASLQTRVRELRSRDPIPVPDLELVSFS